MALWKHTLNLADVYRINDEDLSVEKVRNLAKVIAERLKPILHKTTTSQLPLEIIIRDFTAIAESQDDDEDLELLIEDFDYIMNDLYDIADQEVSSSPLTKFMWVKTF